MRKFTEEERNEFCAKALIHVKKQYSEVWKPQSFENGSRKMLCKRCKQYYCLNTKWEVFIAWSPTLEKHYSELIGSRTWL